MSSESLPEPDAPSSRQVPRPEPLPAEALRPESGQEPQTEILPARRLKAEVAGLYIAGPETFVTAPAARLTLDFGGIVGDLHHGAIRRSGGREPWYPRGTEMRNERQLSLIGADELVAIASALGIARLAPEWLGANMVLKGVPRLSMLPPRTLLFFDGGVTLKVDGMNAPCRIAGEAIAERCPEADPADLSLAFVAAARRRRGLVAWVERPGVVEPGERLTAQLPEQWLYR